MTLDLGNILLVLSVMLFISIAAGQLGFKLGIPSLLLFLFVGMTMGSDGVGFHFDNFEFAQFIGVLALGVILFAGGMDTRVSEIKPIWKEGIILATLGVLLTALFTGAFIFAVDRFFDVKFTLAESFLLAAVMSSTDSASVFSVLRSKGLNLSNSLRPMLELESGSNDPMAYLLTIGLIQYIKTQTIDGSLAWTFFAQLLIGLASGILLGKLAVKIINSVKLNTQPLYSVFLIACVIFIYSITDKFGGNGYLAVYLSGLVVGNSKIMYKREIRGFFSSFTWLWQILMFLTLGLLVNPKDLLPVAVFGLLTGLFMIIAGRPLSVFICLLPFKNLSLRARSYISWVGLRGAVPIIFATYPVLAHIPHADIMFNTVFFITIMSLVIQGSTVPLMAKIFGVGNTAPADAEEFGFELPEDVKSSLSEISVDEKFLMNGKNLRELKLPPHTLVIFVKRLDKYFIPSGNTELTIGDKLLVMSDNPDELKNVFDRLGVKSYNIRNCDS